MTRTSLDAAKEMTFNRLAAEASALRFQGQTAAAVTAKRLSKAAAADAAGISRPTLDRWLERAAAGGTLTVDWSKLPQNVTLDGVEVAVRVGSHPTGSGPATYLTGPRASVIHVDDPLATELEHVILAPGGVVVLDPAYLDAAVVFIVRGYQQLRAHGDFHAARRARRAERPEPRADTLTG